MQVNTVLARFRNREGTLGPEASLKLMPDAATALAQMGAALVCPCQGMTLETLCTPPVLLIHNPW